MSKHESTLAISVISFDLAGAIVLLLVTLLRKRMSVHSIMYVSLPIMLLGLLVASLADSFAPTLVQMCVNTGTTMLTVFTLIVVSDRAYRFGFSAVFLISILRAILYVGTLIGMFLVNATATAGGSGYRVLLYIGALLIATAGTFFWLKGPSIAVMFPAGDQRQAECEAPEALSSLQSSLPDQINQYRSMMLARCAQLSEENRLSPRETEVLVCLARGMSIPRIENELTISANTVKTHVNHIYRKLGIHSRDELKILLAIE